jgi:hypothetical protein
MDIFINRNNWLQFSPEEMENFKEEIFQYYRQKGFPNFKYPTSQAIPRHVFVATLVAKIL